MKIKYFIFFLSINFLITGCQTGSDKNPPISFEDYKITDGFEIQLAASEPLIEAPVAMDFDNKGRMWVVEMRGYMPNLAGTGEDKANGRITILDDLDKEGRARHSKVFLDSLVLPRAIALVYGGLLYAAPPNLWFVEIKNDKPGKRTLVDSTYADEYSNPEGQANGLMMDIDNWIYSANSTSRYQLKDGKWIKEPTSSRGQFGITKDNFGRLYYNYNEIQIAGDYVLPNTLINNPYLKPKEAINRILTDNQKVYPLHPTTVNRGYAEGILNKDSLLVNVTAACGPLVYRGDQFPDDYHLNAFVCEPEANLVKRNILTFGALETTAKQAWDNREFIASTDEGFRPVNLLGGPDGAMYVVDMHRGIIQHRAFATPYYRNSIAHKELDTLLRAGRILRIKYKGKPLSKIPDLLHATGSELVALLKSTNGWVRDRAQQLLIYKQDKSVIPELQGLVEDQSKTLTAIHALHTLDGLNGLSFELLQKVAASSENPMLTAHALLLLEKYNSKDHVTPMVELVNNLINRNDTIVNLYVAISLGSWISVSKDTFMPILAKLSQMYPGSAVYQEAIVNSLNGLEEKFEVITKSNLNKNSDELLDNLLAKTIKNKHEGKMNSIYVKEKVPDNARINGLAIFRNTCSSCHGADGEGIANIAPPLNGSQYVEGPSERLAMIILNGLQGPIHIKGQAYKFNGSMPNFGNNYTDKQIGDIIDYLHNSFVPADPKLHYGSKSISAEKIKNLRNKSSGVLTEKDLLKMINLEN